MEKDTVYSLRMSSRVRAALNKAAKRECRSVASLLDKIIADYLQKQGLLESPEFQGERRRFFRKKIPLTSRTFLKLGGQIEHIPSVIRDISPGGVMVTYPKGAQSNFESAGMLPHFELHVELPGTNQPLCFECDAHHIRDTSEEIQVGASFTNPDESDMQRLEGYIM
jgi:hypothetical protein